MRHTHTAQAQVHAPHREARLSPDTSPDPRHVLAGLMAVVAEHDQRDVNGWCLACLRGGSHHKYPCEVRRRYEKAAQRLRDTLARPAG